MKQVFKSNLGIVVTNVPIPPLGDKQVLVRVVNSLISTGTETSSMKRANLSFAQKVHKNRNNLVKLSNYFRDNGLNAAKLKVAGKLSPPKELNKLHNLGYSVSGLIVEVGKSVNGLKIGDRVACAGSGFAVHAEYVAVPTNLVALMPENVEFSQAAFTTVGCIALHGLRRAGLQVGDTVVIVGLGLLGLLGVQLAKASGLKVIGIDLLAEKLDLATQLGADHIFNAADPDLVKRINNCTDGIGADAAVVYAATKSSSVVNLAMQYCRRKARVVIVGDVTLNIQREHMYEKEIDVLMSTSYGPGRYDDQYELGGIDYPIAYVKWTENRNMQSFLHMLGKGLISVEQLISKEFPVEEAKKAFDFLVGNANTGIGVLLKYEAGEIDKKNNNNNKVIINDQLESVSGKIKVGFIGCGSFIQKNHLPNIYKLRDVYSIETICDIAPGVAALMGKKYKARKITSDYTAVLGDPDIDLVIIGTRHDTHGKIVIEALNNGKHVFVEKPLCITMEDLETISSLCQEHTKQLMVGFNRRFSPLTKAIKEVLDKDSSSKYVVYRVNAGLIPKTVWIQDLKIGGGRIIGECCHFIDYMKYLLGTSITSYSYSRIPRGNNGVETDDNICINCCFEDGSLGVLLYTAVGNPKLPKEQVEIHFSGKSILLDNFLSVSFNGINRKNIKSTTMQKGFVEEMMLFADTIHAGKNLIELNSIIDTTKITINVQHKISV